MGGDHESLTGRRHTQEPKPHSSDLQLASFSADFAAPRHPIGTGRFRVYACHRHAELRLVADSDSRTTCSRQPLHARTLSEMRR